MRKVVDASPRFLSALCWPVAILAYAGAVGLILGVADLSVSSIDRLPFGTPALAGIILAIVVGVPMTVAAVRTQHNRDNGAPSAFVAGVVLVAWVLVQAVITREVDVLLFLALVAGMSIAAFAYRAFPRP